MRLKIENLGKIKQADVRIDAITVITGYNNTGKSTVSKTLYTIFNSFYNIDNQVKRRRDIVIRRTLYEIGDYLNENTTIDYFEFSEQILSNKSIYLNDKEALKKKILEFFECEGDKTYEIIDDKIERITEALKTQDNELINAILQKNLEDSFNRQINSLYDVDSICKIILGINDRDDLAIEITDNNIKKITNFNKLNSEAIYIDDPYVLDKPLFILRPERHNDIPHREHLRSCLRKKEEDEELSELLIAKKLSEVYNKLDCVCSGKIYRKNSGHAFYQEDKALFNIRNVSTGLKCFIIIKTLLLNGSLKERGVLILDEPEIHLHPEWQIDLAEIIVRIQKAFNLHILINTHSPYFLNAIEVSAYKHDILKDCAFYLSEEDNEEKNAVIKDVTLDLERIYKKFAKPLQGLEDSRHSDD
ncbi:MAG: ATP-binding protein [Oscillospiraceae bacterium]|nr:ATP-binding protein [Oscillospiraceae bacterium]